MNDIMTATPPAHRGKGYYLRRIFQQMPAVSANSGYPTAVLLAKYALYHIFERTEFEDFRALRLYEYNHRRRRDFLLTCHVMHFSDILNAQATPEQVARVDDKHLFDQTFREFIHRDWLYLADASLEEVQAFMAKNPVFLVKVCLSDQGKGVAKYTAEDTDARQLMAAYGGKPFVMEAFVAQHPAMAAPNPSTVNTIRVQTARKGERVLLLGGCLRCGGAGAFVDNFHAGGLAYPLDMETGVVVAPGRKLTGEYVRRHPSTGLFMPGFQVPMWDEVIRAVKKAAVTVPNVGYVGWDVALTADGPEFIEGNINYPDSIVDQLDGLGCYWQLKDFVES